MLAPKKSKFKKYQKGKKSNKVSSCTTFMNIRYNSVYLKTLEFGRLSANQLTSIIQVIKKKTKKQGKTLLRVFPHISISKKPIEVRMGKGKGSHNHWVAKVRSGSLILEVVTSTPKMIAKFLNLARIRLPLLTKVVYNIK